jgi:hypothetical protein
MLFGTITVYFVFLGIIATGIFTTIAFIGGAFDLAYLFRELRAKEIDEVDDGRVEYNDKAC